MAEGELPPGGIGDGTTTRRRGLRNRHKLAEMGSKTGQGSTRQDPQKADHQSIIFLSREGGAKSFKYRPMPVWAGSRPSGGALLSGYQMNALEYAEYSVECSLHSSGVREVLRVPKYNLNRGIKKEIKKLY